MDLTSLHLYPSVDPKEMVGWERFAPSKRLNAAGLKGVAGIWTWDPASAWE